MTQGKVTSHKNRRTKRSTNNFRQIKVTAINSIQSNQASPSQGLDSSLEAKRIMWLKAAIAVSTYLEAQPVWQAPGFSQ